MSADETAEARRELAELRRLIGDLRTDLGIAEPKPSAAGSRRPRLRGARKGRRQTPVA